MNKLLLSISCIMLAAVSHANELTNKQNDKIKQEITKTMSMSVNCWNNGDLKCFMNGYAHNDKTTFISGNKFIHGWQSSYDHYKEKYGNDKKGMGKLQITVDAIEPLDFNHAYLYGKWQLVANDKEYNGVTSLIFQKISGKWEIILDHSN